MADHDAPTPDVHADTPAVSPAAGHTPIQGRISLRVLPWCGKINLRGDPGDPEFVNAAGEALGIPLPLDANTTSTGAAGTLFWLGPDEWLLHCEIEQTETFMQQLAARLAPFHHAATEVSDYCAVLELSGKDAGAVLSRGCPLDLHERAFKATHCARTRFGSAGVLLYKPGAEPSFQIQVRWSFTEYVRDYLATVIAIL